MKKLTKTIFALIVLTTPLFFMACEEEATFAPSVQDTTKDNSHQTEDTEDILD